MYKRPKIPRPLLLVLRPHRVCQQCLRVRMIVRQPHYFDRMGRHLGLQPIPVLPDPLVLQVAELHQDFKVLNSKARYVRRNGASGYVMKEEEAVRSQTVVREVTELKMWIKEIIGMLERYWGGCRSEGIHEGIYHLYVDST